MRNETLIDSCERGNDKQNKEVEKKGGWLTGLNGSR